MKSKERSSHYQLEGAKRTKENEAWKKKGKKEEGNPNFEET